MSTPSSFKAHIGQWSYQCSMPVFDHLSLCTHAHPLHDCIWRALFLVLINNLLRLNQAVLPSRGQILHSLVLGSDMCTG